MRITIYTKDGYTYWAESGSESELLMHHLIGDHRVYGDHRLNELKRLAQYHDWAVTIKHK